MLDMVDQLATSSMFTQRDVPSASNYMDPVSNLANSDTESGDYFATSHAVFLLDQLKAPNPSDLACK